MIEPELIIRILLELSVLMVGAFVALMVGWQWKQDKKIAEMEKLLVEFREMAKAIRGLAEHNIPDAWTEADKSKDMLIENLTKLCLRFCGKSMDTGE